MGFLSKNSSGSTDTTSIQCGDILTIAQAAGIHEQLKEGLGRGGEIELQAATIERIDASVLQAYTAFFKAARARKIKVEWIEPSDALLRSAALLGLSDDLDLPRG